MDTIPPPPSSPLPRAESIYVTAEMVRAKQDDNRSAARQQASQAKPRRRLKPSKAHSAVSPSGSPTPSTFSSSIPAAPRTALPPPPASLRMAALKQQGNPRNNPNQPPPPPPPPAPAVNNSSSTPAQQRKQQQQRQQHAFTGIPLAPASPLPPGHKGKKGRDGGGAGQTTAARRRASIMPSLNFSGGGGGPPPSPRRGLLSKSPSLPQRHVTNTAAPSRIAKRGSVMLNSVTSLTALSSTRPGLPTDAKRSSNGDSSSGSSGPASNEHKSQNKGVPVHVLLQASDNSEMYAKIFVQDNYHTSADLQEDLEWMGYADSHGMPPELIDGVFAQLCRPTTH